MDLTGFGLSVFNFFLSTWGFQHLTPANLVGVESGQQGILHFESTWEF